MRPAYDFRDGIRGKYAARYRAGTNVVVLAPDVAAAFATSEAMNRALRALLEVMPPQRRRRRIAQGDRDRRQEGARLIAEALDA